MNSEILVIISTGGIGLVIASQDVSGNAILLTDIKMSTTAGAAKGLR